MKTMGLTRLSLVNPKTFPCADATARAAGADDILYRANVCESLSEALTGTGWVIGTSARARHIAWPEFSPKACAQSLFKQASQCEVAIVFGRENSGLTNAELERCHGVVRIPTDESFGSLNLAAAVQIIGYEIRLAMLANQLPLVSESDPPVTVEEMEGLYAHLEQTLIEIEFLNEAAPKLLMRRLRKLFNRTQIDRSELNILRGILTAAQRAARR